MTEAGIADLNEVLSKLQTKLDESKQANLSLQHECDQLAAKIKEKQSQIHNYNKQVSYLFDSNSVKALQRLAVFPEIHYLTEWKNTY